MKGTLLLLGIAAVLVSTAGATYLNIEGPVNVTVHNNESIFLGKIGPGESFYILASPETTNSTGYLANVGWDTLVARVPPGWAAEASPLYQNPMKMKVTVSPNAKNGTYEVAIKAVNVGNYSKLGNLTVDAYVNVTPDVYSFKVSPLSLSAGVGQPSDINIWINNTGISDDPFIISAEGLPAWNMSDEVISLHFSKGTFTYPVFMNEPGVYRFNLSVSSASSPLIQRTYPARFTVKESLLNDYSAVGQGVDLSPIIFEPTYAVMSLISGVYKYFTHR